MKRRLLRAAFAAAGGAYLGLFATLVLGGRLSVASGGGGLFVGWAGLWILYLVAAGSARGAGVRIGAFAAVLLPVPFFAITLLAEPPSAEVFLGDGERQVFRGWLSNDYHRFLFDGTLLREGTDPYVVVPESVADGPAASHVPFINHADLPTFYSPLAEGWFLAVVASGLGWRAFVIGNLLAHALTILLLGSLLRRWLGPRRTGPMLLLFALNPLVLVELTVGLHYDPLVALALLGILWGAETGRRTTAAACFVGAVGLKLFPLVLAPVIVRKVGWVRTGIALGALALLHVPFATERTFDVYRAFLSMPVNPSPFALALPAIVRAALAAGVALWFAFRPGERGAWLLGPVLALVLLSETVHPWYALWVLPPAMLALRTRGPVLAFSFAVFFGYDVLIGLFQRGTWAPTGTLPLLGWLVLLAGLTWTAWFRLRRRPWPTLLLLAWPLVPLLALGYRFEAPRFLPEWADSFPYFAWAFDADWTAPYGMRALAWLPAKALAGLAGLGPVVAGYLLLGVGHLAAVGLLWRILRTARDERGAGSGLVLYLLTPYFLLLPWGSVTGGLAGPPGAGWHFSQVSEAVYLPLAFLAILRIRLRRGPWPTILLLGLLLATKESAFLFVALYWIVDEGPSRLRVGAPVVLGVAYLAALRLAGLEYPDRYAAVLPAFTRGHLAANGWPLAILGAWLAGLAVFLPRGFAGRHGKTLAAYLLLLLAFSMFWETRLWLVAAPVLLLRARWPGARAP